MRDKLTKMNLAASYKKPTNNCDYDMVILKHYSLQVCDRIIPRHIGILVCRLLCRVPGVSVPIHGTRATSGSHLVPAHTEFSFSNKVY